MDPVGATIGALSLLTAFRGAIDGYLLIDRLLDSDSGQRYLCLRYIVEKHKLALWGDHFSVHDQAHCTLDTQPAQVRRIILALLQEIKAQHQVANSFLRRYEGQLENLIVDSESKERSTTSDIAAAFQTTSVKLKKEKHHWSFVIRDKENFESVVARLGKLNDDLYDVLDFRTSAYMKNALSSYVLAGVNESNWLESLGSSESPFPSLISLSARLKQMEKNRRSEGDVVKRIERDQISYGDGIERSQGLYQSSSGASCRVWIEWKYIAAQESQAVRTGLMERVEHLGELLLSTKDPIFRIPPFLGLFRDTEFELTARGKQRIGLVYSSPRAESDPRTMQNLVEFIRETRMSKPGGPPLPTLGDRYQLAFALASSLTLLHASRWLHRSFSSYNILLFRTSRQTSHVSVVSPYLAGFGFSRLASHESLDSYRTGDPNRDLYVHPQASAGFRKKFDIYSLGVVLFEIALWSPINEKLTKSLKTDLSKVTATQTRDELIKNVHLLGHLMGEVYQNVVHTCLTGEYANGFVDADEDLLARAVFTDIITPLGGLKA